MQRSAILSEFSRNLLNLFHSSYFYQNGVNQHQRRAIVRPGIAKVNAPLAQIDEVL